MRKTDCERARQLLDPYIDGELAAEEIREVECHVGACPECRNELDELTALRSSLRAAVSERAPMSLWRRVRERLLGADQRRSRHAQLCAWSISAVGYAGAAVAGAAVAYFALASWADFEISAREVVAAHVRSLGGAGLTQVASSDLHRVRPWFAGKVAFAPQGRDLSEQGFPLIGGRTEHFQGTRAAVLVYRRRAHIINVFVVPRSGDLGARAWQRDGFNVRHWNGKDLDYWAISDLNERELGDLARLLGESSQG